MIQAIQEMVRVTDQWVAKAYLSVFQERNALIAFLFHSLFRDEAEMQLKLVDPLQRTTVDQFRCLIAYYLQRGYTFVSPKEILAGLDPNQKYGVLTFDDGYFNNALALSILEEFDVPGLFFIATENVIEQKCYWWDVLYRELSARGDSPSRIRNQGLEMKSLRTEEIETRLKARFGSDAFIPRGEIDRPFNVGELREFASHRLVHIGNHTANHAILTNYSPEEAREQLLGAQKALREISGTAPAVIAYPNGAYNAEVVQICREIGLKLGFTIQPAKTITPLGLGSDDAMELGRFAPLGDRPLESQCQTFRSDLVVYGILRQCYVRINRGRMVG